MAYAIQEDKPTLMQMCRAFMNPNLSAATQAKIADAWQCGFKDCCQDRLATTAQLTQDLVTLAQLQTVPLPDSVTRMIVFDCPALPYLSDFIGLLNTIAAEQPGDADCAAMADLAFDIGYAGLDPFPVMNSM